MQKDFIEEEFQRIYKIGLVDDDNYEEMNIV